MANEVCLPACAPNAAQTLPTNNPPCPPPCDGATSGGGPDVENLLLCDTGPDGEFLGTALAVYEYDSDGNPVGAPTFVDPVTGAPYVVQGILRPCGTGNAGTAQIFATCADVPREQIVSGPNLIDNGDFADSEGIGNTSTIGPGWNTEYCVVGNIGCENITTGGSNIFSSDGGASTFAFFNTNAGQVTGGDPNATPIQALSTKSFAVNVGPDTTQSIIEWSIPLVNGQFYQISADVAIIYPPYDVKLTIDDVDILALTAPTANGQWQRRNDVFEWTGTSGLHTLALKSNSGEPAGNDHTFDNFSLRRVNPGQLGNPTDAEFDSRVRAIVDHIVQTVGCNDDRRDSILASIAASSGGGGNQIVADTICVGGETWSRVTMYETGAGSAVDTKWFGPNGSVESEPAVYTIGACSGNSLNVTAEAGCADGVPFTRVRYYHGDETGSIAFNWVGSDGIIHTVEPVGWTLGECPEIETVVTAELGCANAIPFTRVTFTQFNNATGGVAGLPIVLYVDSAGVANPAFPAGWRLGPCDGSAEFDNDILCTPDGDQVLVVVSYSPTGIPSVAAYNFPSLTTYGGDLTLLVACAAETPVANIEVDQQDTSPVKICFENAGVVKTWWTYDRVTWNNTAPGNEVARVKHWTDGVTDQTVIPAGTVIECGGLSVVTTSEIGCAAGVSYRQTITTVYDENADVVGIPIITFLNDAGVAVAAPAGFTLGACPPIANSVEFAFVEGDEPGCANGVPWNRRRTGVFNRVSGDLITVLYTFANSANIQQAVAPAGFTLGACPPTLITQYETAHEQVCYFVAGPGGGEVNKYDLYEIVHFDARTGLEISRVKHWHDGVDTVVEPEGVLRDDCDTPYETLVATVTNEAETTVLQPTNLVSWTIRHISGDVEFNTHGGLERHTLFPGETISSSIVGNPDGYLRDELHIFAPAGSFRLTFVRRE